MSYFRYQVATVIIFIGISVAGPFSSWAVPRMINFQGTLAAGDGEHLDGTFSINFLFYDVKADSDPIWKETQDIYVSDGLYSVQLGSIDPFPAGLFDNDDLFLEIRIYNDGINDWETLAPRMRVTSTAFAMKAAEAETVSNGTITSVMLSPGAVTTPVLSDQSVTAAKIGGGAVGSAQIADGSVAAIDIDFNYAAGNAKAGAALDLECTDCVSSLEIQTPLNLSGASADAVVKGTNTGNGVGLYGEHGSGSFGYLGGSGAGVYGRAANGTTGWLGSPSYGVYGYSASGYAGLFAGDIAISGSGKGLKFPDGTRQTTATAGGVPSGFSILGKNVQPHPVIPPPEHM
jgi:hypothetical protein